MASCLWRWGGCAAGPGVNLLLIQELLAPVFIGMKADMTLNLAPSPPGAAACGSKSANADLDRPKSFRLRRLPVRLGWGQARCELPSCACPHPTLPREGRE